MANELTLNLKVKYEKNGITDTRTFSDNVDVSGAFLCGGVQTIGTTEELLAVGDVATKGYARFMNIDATNYVEIGSYVAATFYPLIKLKAGETAVCRLSAVTVYARANTAAVNLDYMIFSD